MSIIHGVQTHPILEADILGVRARVGRAIRAAAHCDVAGAAWLVLETFLDIAVDIIADARGGVSEEGEEKKGEERPSELAQVAHG